jgi:hypothetical protein
MMDNIICIKNIVTLVFAIRLSLTFGDLEFTANTKTPAHPFSSWLHTNIKCL